MNKNYLLPPNTKSLNQRSTLIKDEEFGSSYIEDVIKLMLDTTQGLSGNKNKRTMVGLAAPQIGINRRLILIDLNADGTNDIIDSDFLILINPTVTYKSKNIIEGREGCFSTGNVCGVVERSVSTTVKAFDNKGVESVYKFMGFTARVVQHEIDHLNGVRFPSRILNDQKLHWVGRNEFSLYREKWQSWDNICPRQRYSDLIK